MNEEDRLSNLMGERINQKRNEMGYTMEELGEKVGVKASAVNKWEKGIVKNIKRETIANLATILECSPAWLMGISNTEYRAYTYYDMFTNKNGENSEIETVIRLFQELNSDQQESIINLMKSMKK